MINLMSEEANVIFRLYKGHRPDLEFAEVQNLCALIAAYVCALPVPAAYRFLERNPTARFLFELWFADWE